MMDGVGGGSGRNVGGGGGSVSGSVGSEVSTNDPDEDFLLWRRLQLSKAKLKGVTEMAALMAGFSVIATVELTIKETTNEALLVIFSVTTALLVSTTMLSIMIATCVLPHIEALSKMESIALCKQSPHEDMIWYIDLAWFLANTLSIFLFIMDVVLLCWIKFEPAPAICITSIMIPVLVLLCVFSIVFYRQTVVHQISVADRRLDELRAMSVRLKLSPEEQADVEAALGAAGASGGGANGCDTASINSDYQLQLTNPHEKPHHDANTRRMTTDFV